MAYSSNLNNEINKISDLLANLPIDEITASLGQYLVASNIERIHEDGKDVNMAKIGNYSNRPPVYINPSKAVRKKGVGTPGTFKNGKKKKTVKFDSYKDYRSSTGRRVDTVNLNLTGKLQSDLNLVVKGNVAEVGFTTDYGATVSDGLESKYAKTIWGVSKEDSKVLVEITLDEVSKFIKNNL
jgi:hypothetical protein